MKEKIVLLLFSFLSLYSNGQSKFIAKLDVTALVDPLRPAIQPGLEYKISDRFAITGDVGFRYLPKSQLTRWGRMDNNYYRLEGELRYYLSNGLEEGRNNFIGFGTSFFDQTYFLENRSVSFERQNIFFTRSDASRKTTTYFLEYGFQYLVSKKWSFDYYMELGIRNVDIEQIYTNPISSPDFGTDCFPVICSLRNEDPGKHNFLYFWIGIKLGYFL